MSAVDTEQLLECLTFLTHSNPTVRLQALKILQQFTDDNTDTTGEVRSTLLDHNAILQLKPLCDDKSYEIVVATLTLLINFSTLDTAIPQFIQHRYISDCYERIVEGSRSSTSQVYALHLYLMLLANMTRQPQAVATLLQEGKKIEGLHVLRLINRFLEPYELPENMNSLSAEERTKVTINNDRYSYIGHILANVSTVGVGRNLLMDSERSLLKPLSREILSINPVRRLGVLTTIRNCFMDTANHEQLLAEDTELYELMLIPVVGNEPLRDEEYMGMPLLLARTIKGGKHERNTSRDIRQVVLDIIALCARHKPSRIILRDRKVYPILRELHKYEESVGNTEVDDTITSLVTDYFLADEEPEPKVVEVKDASEEKRGVDVSDSDDDEPPPLIEIDKLKVTESEQKAGAASDDELDDDGPPPLIELPADEAAAIAARQQAQQSKPADLSFLDFVS